MKKKSLKSRNISIKYWQEVRLISFDAIDQRAILI